MKYYIAFLLGILIFPAVSQIIYSSAIDSISHQHDFFELNIKDCSFIQICNDQPYRDFSIRPITNEWVFVETTNPLGWYNMNKCQLVNWGGTIISSFSKFVNNGQESDRYGYLWCFGPSGIIKVNPPSLFYEFKGSIDSNSFGSVSWATFLNGKVYALASLKNDPVQFYVAAFDTSNTMNFNLVSVLPRTFFPQGIFALHNSCGENSIVISSKNHDFYLLDLNTGSFNFMCNLKLPNIYHDVYLGSSPWQYNPSDCDVFLDLDINNSSGDKQNGFINSLTCSARYALLSDIDPDVFSDYGLMDSIQISIRNPMDGLQEFIFYQNKFNISSALWNNNLSLYPFGSASNDSFELALKSLLYVNQACMITEADRYIQFIAFKNGISDTAFCIIHVNGPFYNAGQDGTLSICSNDPPASLNSILGSCYTPGGKWSPLLHDYGIYNPVYDTANIYYYIVGDSICGFDSAQIDVSLQAAPVFKLPNDTILCFGDSLILNIINASASYLWNDSSTVQQKIIKSPGIYWLELSNLNNCYYSDSIYISYFPKNQVSKEIYICANQILEYKANFYHPGDLIVDTLPSSNDCDTFVQITVLAIPVPAPKLIVDTLICQNSLTSIRTDQIYTNYLWSTQDQTNAIIAHAGSYSLTVTDLNGCTNSVSINIHEISPIQCQNIAFDPICTDDKGRIQLKAVSGGAPPYRYFLNGVQSTDGLYDQLNPGIYFAQIIDSETCLQSDTIQIIAAPQFNVSLIDNIELQTPGSILIKYIVLDGSIKLISFSPSHQISLEGNDGLRIQVNANQDYTIQFEDLNGCVITRYLQISLKKNDRVIIPNAFSPNGDNINDFWEPFIGSDYTIKQCTIYDRWGNMVYQTKSSIIWDGRYNDLPCIPGVYIYCIELQNNINQIKKRSGDLTIIR
ncbi:MAG: gliding motility-associated C-terminal domain-containing protein [Saprospiraceae bacterium]